MLRRLLFGLDEKTLVRINTPYTAEESARRLATAVSDNSLKAVFGQTLYGTVSVAKVELERLSLIKNDFRPVFSGAFEPYEGGAALVGVFSMRGRIVRFLTSATAFGLLWSGGALLSIVLQGWNNLPLWFPLAGLAMAALFVTVAHVAFALSRGDIDWMQDRIRDALAGVVP